MNQLLCVVVTKLLFFPAGRFECHTEWIPKDVGSGEPGHAPEQAHPSL